MKRIIIILFFILLPIPLISRDLKELEEIINSILVDEIEEEKEIVDSMDNENETIKKNIQSNISLNKSEKDIRDSKPISVSTSDKVLLETGLQLINIRQFESALDKFNDLKTGYPQSPYIDNAKIWSAKAYIELNKYNEAIRELSSISDNSGEYPSSLFYIGETEANMNHNERAIEFYYKVALQFPEHHLADNALLRISNIFIDNNNGIQALETLMKLIKYYEHRETIDDTYFLLAKVFERDPVFKDYEITRKIYKLFLRKAKKEKDLNFHNSPLIGRIELELNSIEKILRLGN